MYRADIRLDTMSDIKKFLAITQSIETPVVVEDSAGHRVNAKSLLGMLYAMEFNHLYLVCDKDESSRFSEFLL